MLRIDSIDKVEDTTEVSRVDFLTTFQAVKFSPIIAKFELFVLLLGQKTSIVILCCVFLNLRRLMI